MNASKMLQSDMPYTTPGNGHVKRRTLLMQIEMGQRYHFMYEIC